MAKKILSKQVNSKVAKYIGLLNKADIGVKEVYVYGSQAKGTQHKDSDIDVCVLADSFGDYADSIEILNKKADENELYEIEAVGFTPEEFHSDKYWPLIQEIKQTGIRII